MVADYLADSRVIVKNKDKLDFDASMEPRFLIKMVLADVGPKDPTSRQRGKAGYRGKIKLTTMDEIKDYLNPDRWKSTATVDVQTQGAPTLSFQPPRLTSTVGGLCSHLTGICNVVQTPAKSLDSSHIVNLTLSISSASISARRPFFSFDLLKPNVPNVTVPQKVISQPTLRLRRWMEEEKKIVPKCGEHSISDPEFGLLPFRGEGASIIKYLEELEQAQEPQDDFYNGNNILYKRHAWDAGCDRQEEFRTMANRLLNAIGGSVGAKRKEKNMVAIGIGLGQHRDSQGAEALFWAKRRLTTRPHPSCTGDPT
ncbi:hypothetical protein KI688_008728 [Linnemannia hyalina]|uniref:Uncharacterized protein n=1 Tax=Linnemannia hyalina TaxID=64524 RepID=A0A9P8BXC0_9FUNG|nr:hypothetical protein KI688_008728 [Linnemannia hyalina]